MATTKNKKVSEAAKFGRKSDFWNWIASLAQKVLDYATVKMNAADIRQSELLNEVRSISAMYTPENENS
jgi:hypothetical protein